MSYLFDYVSDWLISLTANLLKKIMTVSKTDWEQLFWEFICNDILIAFREFGPILLLYN